MEDQQNWELYGIFRKWTIKLSFLFRTYYLFIFDVALKTVQVSKPPAPWLTSALKVMMVERNKNFLKYKNAKK